MTRNFSQGKKGREKNEKFSAFFANMYESYFEIIPFFWLEIQDY